MIWWVLNQYASQSELHSRKVSDFGEHVKLALEVGPLLAIPLLPWDKLGIVFQNSLKQSKEEYPFKGAAFVLFSYPWRRRHAME